MCTNIIINNTYICDPNVSTTMATRSSHHVDVQACVITVLILVLIVVLTMQTDLVLSKYAPILAISNKRRILEKFYHACGELANQITDSQVNK